MEVDAQLVSDGPCLSRAAYTIVKVLGNLEVSPNFMIMDNGMGRIPVEREGTVLICVSRGPSLQGVCTRTVETEV